MSKEKTPEQDGDSHFNSANKRILDKRLQRWSMSKATATQIYEDFRNYYTRAVGFSNAFFKINSQKVISWLISCPRKWRSYKKLIHFAANNFKLLEEMNDERMIYTLFKYYIYLHTETPTSTPSIEEIQDLVNFFGEEFYYKNVRKRLDKAPKND